MLRGIAETWRSPEVRKSYRFVPLVIVLFTLSISVMGLWGIVRLSNSLAHTAEGAQWLRSAVTWIVGVVFVIASPLLALFVFNLLFPLFADRPFLAGVREIAPDKALVIETLPGLNLTSSLAVNVRRILRLLLRLALCFLLSLIPVIGAIVAPPLSVYFLATGTGWELLDPYFDRKRYSYSQQLELVTKLHWEVLGLGLVSLPLLAIPLVGPLFFGVLQAGVARFTVEIFVNKEEPEFHLRKAPTS
jgi:uncharacterized protein involved in cysteine biosynthesis